MTFCQRLVASILVCTVASVSARCTSMKTIRPAAPGSQQTEFGNLQAGDLVSIRTKDGRTARFVVQQVETNTIVAPDGARYASADIAELKRRSFSGPRTAGLVGGIVAGLVIILAAAAAAALDGLWGSGG